MNFYSKGRRVFSASTLALLLLLLGGCTQGLDKPSRRGHVNKVINSGVGEMVPEGLVNDRLNRDVLLAAPEAYLYDREVVAFVEAKLGQPSVDLTRLGHDYIKRLYGNPGFMYRMWETRSLAQSKDEEVMFCRELFSRLDLALLRYLHSVGKANEEELYAFETVEPLEQDCASLLERPYSVSVEDAPFHPNR